MCVPLRSLVQRKKVDGGWREADEGDAEEVAKQTLWQSRTFCTTTILLYNAKRFTKLAPQNPRGLTAPL